jgi:hypothetical protein
LNSNENMHLYQSIRFYAHPPSPAYVSHLREMGLSLQKKRCFLFIYCWIENTLEAKTKVYLETIRC